VKLKINSYSLHLTFFVCRPIYIIVVEAIDLLVKVEMQISRPICNNLLVNLSQRVLCFLGFMF